VGWVLAEALMWTMPVEVAFVLTQHRSGVRGRGNVQVSSISGLVGFPPLGAYHASKFALEGPGGQPLLDGWRRPPPAYEPPASAHRAGLRTTKPHGTRHFRASALVSTGADISAVSQELGHTTISVTSDMYGHLFEKASKRIAKAAILVPRAKKAAKSKEGKSKEGKSLRDEAAWSRSLTNKP
jgi:hypothetical protein